MRIAKNQNLSTGTKMQCLLVQVLFVYYQLPSLLLVFSMFLVR